MTEHHAEEGAGRVDRDPPVDSDPDVQIRLDPGEQLRLALRARDLSDALFEIGRHLSLATDPQDVAEIVLGLACEAVDGCCAKIDRRELGGWVTSSLYGASLAQVGAFHRDLDSQMLAELKRTGNPVINSPDRAPANHEPDGAAAGTVVGAAESRCLPRMSFPLTLRGRVVGALTFCMKEDHPTELDEDDTEFGSRLASMLSVVEENSVRLNRHERIAEAFQRALIDMPRAMPELDVGHVYTPAGEADIAGGDFYDVFRLADGRIAVAIGDVSGRGLNAATTTALVRDAIRVTALDGLTPSRVLGKTSRALLAFASPETFATVFFGMIDPRTGEMEYSCGGNPTPYLVGLDGEITPMGDCGVVLGVLEDAEPITHRATLRVGENLVMYTNGLAVARNAEGVPLGQEGVERALRSVNSRDARGIALDLHERVINYAAGMLPDDIAILVIGLSGAFSTPEETEAAHGEG